MLILSLMLSCKFKLCCSHCACNQASHSTSSALGSHRDIGKGETSPPFAELAEQRSSHASFAIQLQQTLSCLRTHRSSGLDPGHSTRFGGLELIKQWKEEAHATLHLAPPALLEPWHKQVLTRNDEHSQPVLGYFSSGKCSYVRWCLSGTRQHYKAHIQARWRQRNSPELQVLQLCQ